MNEDLVRYRLERAREALEDAEYLFEGKRFRAAMNRLYYSMFYSIVALLETGGFASSKHSGVRALFNRHYVKTGTVSEEAGKTFGLLFAKRHRGDYVDFTEFTEATVTTFLEKCRQYTGEISEIAIKRTAGTS